MAHKKGQGSTRNGRDSPGQHRGIKIYAGQTVKVEGEELLVMREEDLMGVVEK